MLSEDSREGVLSACGEEAEIKRRSGAAKRLSIDDGERATVQVISTRDVDRDGEILVPKGASLDEYRRNPVVMWNHDYSLPPIARTEEIKADRDGITAKAVYAETEFAEDIYNLKKGGFQTAVSVGFVPTEWVLRDGPGWAETVKRLSDEWEAKAKDFDGVSIITTKWVLLEYSDVPIPANPNAYTIAKSVGVRPETVRRLGLEVEPEDTATPDNDFGRADPVRIRVLMRPRRILIRSEAEMVHEAILKAQGRV